MTELERVERAVHRAQLSSTWKNYLWCLEALLDMPDGVLMHLPLPRTS